MNDTNNEIDMQVTRKEFVDAFKQDELDRLRAEVASLKAARKEVLLEAEKVIRDYFAFKSNMHPLQVQDLINELRRMAEGEK